MLQKICCYNTDFCKCECLCLSRNKNVKLAYIAFLLTGFIASFIARAALADPSLDTI